jgi:hypothetical protein
MHSMGSASPTDSQTGAALDERESVGISRNQSESVGISRNQSESVGISLNPSSSMAEIKLLLRSHGYRTSGGDHDIFIKSDGAGTIRFKLHVDDGAGWSNSRTLHNELCSVMQKAWPNSKWDGDKYDPMAFSISRDRKSIQPMAGSINVHSMESTHEGATWYTGWYPGQELPTIPTVVVLCGGKERKGDIKSYVEKLSNPTMHCVVIDPQEGGYAQDLRQPTVRKGLAVWLQSDFIHTILACPNCGWWCALRGENTEQDGKVTPAGPGVVFNSDHPDGLKNESGVLVPEAKAALEMWTIVFTLLEVAVEKCKCEVIIEQPVKRGVRCGSS